jgi:hypothetical protein
MAVPLSTYFMALTLAIRTCFYGETNGMPAATPRHPPLGSRKAQRMKPYSHE